MSAQDDDATALREYGMRVGQAVVGRIFELLPWCDAPAGMEREVNLAAIVASVDLPVKDPFDWKAERAHLKAALARPCISCGYQPNVLAPAEAKPADAQREGK